MSTVVNVIKDFPGMTLMVLWLTVVMTHYFAG
jgi:hypothetical protein